MSSSLLMAWLIRWLCYLNRPTQPTTRLQHIHLSSYVSLDAQRLLQHTFWIPPDTSLSQQFWMHFNPTSEAYVTKLYAAESYCPTSKLQENHFRTTTPQRSSRWSGSLHRQPYYLCWGADQDDFTDECQRWGPAATSCFLGCLVNPCLCYLLLLLWGCKNDSCTICSIVIQEESAL